ncbi:uncharacterized protein LOC112057825 isoform X2 [Bicyclus anynana]|uniref:Uncharacterized protein LOC112057825 isoform X2 n=1 Tax=Bicyclus anynana TaxID=110368 RepID=A0ABM3M6L8_BICAN|nr:uncharacterized protein LOC112057825 isoform X2 [Bicyclus anynana]XP_052747029.1 uncharacterized protein LOC112057825 isoform X2 [Bicyclus anynana]
MSACRAQVPDELAAPAPPAAIAADSPGFPEETPDGIRLRNYRFINEHIREFIPTDLTSVHTSVVKGKLVSKLDVLAVSPPRAKILELLRPEDPGKDALEAIVRPTVRRGLVRPFDEDTRRFLQRALFTNGFNTPERNSRLSNDDSEEESEHKQNSVRTNSSKEERSLADELREAEEDERSGANLRRELLREFRKRGGGIREAMERDRLGKLALSVEDDEDFEDCGLSSAARRLDALLEESRSLHEELAGISEDIQVLARRVSRRDL